MIGTLTRYELKTSLGNTFFLIVLCLLLIVNLLLHCGLQNYLLVKNAVENGEGMGGEPGQEAITFWDQMAGTRRNVTFLRQLYAPFSKLSSEELAAYEASMREKYGDEVFDSLLPTEEMLEVPGYFGGNWSDFDYIFYYQMLLQDNQKIAETMDSVLNGARAYGREALEAGDDYGIRRNLKIIGLYSVPRERITSPVIGWDTFLFENVSMLLVFLLVLFICAGSVAGENDRQTWLLLHTSKNGRGKTLAAKYLAGILSAAGLTVLFQLVTLGAVWFSNGLLGIGQPAAALEELLVLPYTLTVGQYILLNLACQIFAAAVLSVLLTTVSALSKSSVISYAAGVLLLGLCLLPVYAPPRAEWLAGPLSLSRSLKYFDSYYTANLFGFPLLWVVVQAVLWCILGAGCVFLAHKVHYRKRGAM